MMNEVDLYQWKIWKYSIPLKESEGLRARQFSIQLPKHAKILSVAAQHNEPVMWVAIQEDLSYPPLEPHDFILCETGRVMPKDPTSILTTFIGTILLDDGAYVLHIFEITGS